MADVIDFVQIRMEKLARNRQELSLKEKIQTFHLTPREIVDTLMDTHPVTLKHRAEGREWYNMVPRDIAEEEKEKAKDRGYTNIVIENEAVYGSVEGKIKVLKEYCNIYATFPKKNS